MSQPPSPCEIEADLPPVAQPDGIGVVGIAVHNQSVVRIGVEDHARAVLKGDEGSPRPRLALSRKHLVVEAATLIGAVRVLAVLVVRVAPLPMPVSVFASLLTPFALYHAATTSDGSLKRVDRTLTSAPLKAALSLSPSALPMRGRCDDHRVPVLQGEVGRRFAIPVLCRPVGARTSSVSTIALSPPAAQCSGVSHLSTAFTLAPCEQRVDDRRVAFHATTCSGVPHPRPPPASAPCASRVSTVALPPSAAV